MNQIAAIALRIIRLPITLLQLIGRGFGVLLKPISAPIFKVVDESDQLSNLINSVASSTASQRGVPLMAGTALLILSLIMHGIVIVGLVASDSFDRNLYWLCLPLTIFHVGVLAGFTGAMLATPLGQSYKDQ